MYFINPEINIRWLPRDFTENTESNGFPDIWYSFGCVKLIWYESPFAKCLLIKWMDFLYSSGWGKSLEILISDIGADSLDSVILYGMIFPGFPNQSRGFIFSFRQKTNPFPAGFGWPSTPGELGCRVLFSASSSNWVYLALHGAGWGIWWVILTGCCFSAVGWYFWWPCVYSLRTQHLKYGMLLCKKGMKPP